MDQKKINLRELMESEDLIIVPEIYDCSSSRAAEINGFQCIMLSSADFACSMTGIPDLQLLSLDEFVWITERITNAVSMPLIIDADDGFGGRALNTWYASKRLAKAGASGLLVTDAAAQSKAGVAPVDEAVIRFKAARDGMDEGAEGMVLIARCDVDPVENMDEVIERSNKYVEAGADCICVLGMNRAPVERKYELSKKLSDEIPGWHWYPDLSSHDGEPDIDLDDLAKIRYKFVGVHYSMHAAMISMLDTGKHVMESKTNTYVEQHYDDTGYKCFSPMTFYLKDGYWADLEQKYVTDPDDAITKRIMPFFVHETDKF